MQRGIACGEVRATIAVHLAERPSANRTRESREVRPDRRPRGNPERGLVLRAFALIRARPAPASEACEKVTPPERVPHSARGGVLGETGGRVAGNRRALPIQREPAMKTPTKISPQRWSAPRCVSPPPRCSWSSSPASPERGRRHGAPAPCLRTPRRNDPMQLVSSLRRTAGRSAGRRTTVALGGCAALPSRVERRRIARDRRRARRPRSAGSRPPRPARMPRDRRAFASSPKATKRSRRASTLIRSAEKSVDVQYYLIKNDSTGRQFLGALLDCCRARRSRPRPRRRPLTPARRMPCSRRSPSSPASRSACSIRCLAQRRLRRARRPLGAPVRAHQPPHAQQAADRRRQLRDHRRPQHRQRVFRTGRKRLTSSTWTCCRRARWSPRWQSQFDQFWNSPYAYPASVCCAETRRRGDRARRRR